MPRKTSTAIPDVTGPQVTALEDIPDDIKAYVEDVYERQRKNPGRERAEYDTVDELKREFKLMADYAAQRQVNGKAAALKIRRSPTRDLADTVMDFRVTADLPENGQKNAQKEKATAGK